MLSKCLKKILLLSLVLSITFSAVAQPLIANAIPVSGGGGATKDTLYDKMNSTDKARSYLAYNYISYCIANYDLGNHEDWSLGDVNGDVITVDQAESGAWFARYKGITDRYNGQETPAINYYLGTKDNNGELPCNQGASFIKDAFTRLWGYSSMTKALCDSGAQRWDYRDPADCVNSSGKFTGYQFGNLYTDTLSLTEFQTNIITNVYGGVDPIKLRDTNLDSEKAAEYIQDRSSFFTACLGTISPAEYPGSLPESDPGVYKITFVNDKGQSKDSLFYAPTSGGKNKGDSITYYGTGGNKTITCGDLAKKVNDGAASYKNIATIVPDTIQPSKDGGSGTTTSCLIEGIGWILCPVITTMAKIADGAFNILADNFLSTSPQVVAVGGGAYQAWGTMRNIANVAFVMFFLIIIFSQLTGWGIDNYGLKKLLPKIIIAAILVNISFYICQIAVDLSNIVGWGLKDLLSSLGPISANGWGNGLAAGQSFGDIAGGILAGTVAGVALGAGLWASIGTLIPVLLAAVVALIMIVFILVARQAFVILLIVISPLAFVAYLLPNTEPLFKKWFDALKAVLLVFPIIALIYGASSLASGILRSVAGGNVMLQIAYSAVMVLPLFVVPGILKKSLDGFGNIGAKLNAWGEKGGTALGKKAISDKNMLGQALALKEAGANRARLQKQAGTYQGKFGGALMKGKYNPLSFRTRANRALNASPLSGALGNQRAQGGAAVEAEELKNAQVPLQQEIAAQKARIAAGGPGPSLDQFLEARAVSANHSAAQRSAAMHALAATGRDGSIRRLASAGSGADQARLQAAISANAGSLVGKAPDVVKGAVAAFGNVSGGDLAGFSSGTAGAYVDHLRSLDTAATTAATTAAATGLPADIAAATSAAAAFTGAAASFNSAIDDISRDTTLQGSFGPDVGTEIVTAIGRIGDPVFATNLAPGTGRIGANGKIR